MYKKKLVLYGVLFALLSTSFLTSAAAYFDGGGGGNPNPVEKYGFFFWTSYDIGNQQCIDDYESILQTKGYTTYEFKDLKYGNTQYTIASVFNFIDGIEDNNDILFFYFCGHGSYDSYSDISAVCIKSSTLKINSNQLRYYCDKFEATDVSILVDACYAGDFVDMFETKGGYLVMTTSDQCHRMWYHPGGEGCFSDTFWNDLAIYPQHSAVTAFYNAKLVWSVLPRWHYPEIVDNSDYDFF